MKKIFLLLGLSATCFVWAVFNPNNWGFLSACLSMIFFCWSLCLEKPTDYFNDNNPVDVGMMAIGFGCLAWLLSLYVYIFLVSQGVPNIFVISGHTFRYLFYWAIFHLFVARISLHVMIKNGFKLYNTPKDIHNN